MLQDVRDGKLSPEDAESMLKAAPFVELGYAKPDTHRRIRQGSTEVIYGAGKTPEQTIGIIDALMDGGAKCIVVTRTPEKTAALIKEHSNDIECHPDCGMTIVGEKPEPSENSLVCVVSAGTSDMAVAEEAAVAAEAEGSRVVRIYDAGVSGIHRLLYRTDDLLRARAVVVVAGMEGALPSVVGGLVDVPVIAVPTSVGYGVSAGGQTALHAMLASCANGVTVVNIDNGSGAGYVATQINRLAVR